METRLDEDARLALAQRLSDSLVLALGTGLSSEAALIAKTIEAILINQASNLLIKLQKQ